MFNRFLVWIFNIFHFHKKNGKRNTVRFSLFVFMKELKNELLKQIKINFLIIITSVFHNSKFVSSPLRFSCCLIVMRTPINPLFIKRLTYFNVYIAGCYFHIWIIFIVNCDIVTRNNSQPSWVVLLKPSQKPYINFLILKACLKYKQKVRKINVKDFILCSVARITPLIWNTFSCSNKLFPLRQAYPCWKLLIKTNIIYFSY